MKIAHFFLKPVMFAFQVIFPPKMFTLLSKIFNNLYSFYKCNEFKNSANDISLHYPLYLKGGQYITIGNSFYADLRLRLEAWDEHLGDKYTPTILIGNNVSINSDCHIGIIDNLTIEDGVLIASKVFITDHYHGKISSDALAIMPAERKLFSKGPVKIEKNAWIGEGVVILPNVTIGANSIIGANSVITKDIPKNSVVGGNPFRIIRTL